MIPPDYTALEREVREKAVSMRSFSGYKCLPTKTVWYCTECGEGEEDGHAVTCDAVEHADLYEKSADALALAASLQDEIERLKGYAQHKPGCRNGKPVMVRIPDGSWICDGTRYTCSCGLAPETGAT